MKTAEELYKDHIDDQWFCVCDYQPMINELGKVVIQVDDNDYQGDTRVLLRLDDRYGLLIFGWGSCSGCDALQSCQSIEQVQSLFDEMKQDVKWFDSLDLLKKYVIEKDWELEYCWHESETREFIDQVLKHECLI